MLILLEHDRGKLSDASTEALTAGRELAQQLAEPVEALWIGPIDDVAVSEAARYGAETLHVAQNDSLVDYGPDAWAGAVCQLIEEVDPGAVISVGTDRGNEVLAQVAARLDLPFVANCTAVDASAGLDQTWTLTRVQWGGSLLEDATLNADLKLMTYAHHAVVAEPLEAPAAAELEEHDVDIEPADTVTIIQDRVVLSQGVTLSTAPVVVGGGRGVGSADGFEPLETLAELLNGKVGCSRAVTNNGWRPHADQVGQTGTRIAPELYIATGISGAIQHWVGAMASKRILAINTDPEANMVTKADYAIIGDLHKVVPAIIEEVQRRKG